MRKIRYLLVLLPFPPAAAQTWETCDRLYQMNGEAPGDSYGALVRNAWDVDLDGVEDFLVGASGSNAGGPGAGRAYLHSGATGQVLFTWTGNPQENLGNSVNGLGDVNNDEVPDVIVGAPDFAGITAGSAFVFSGSDGSLIHTLGGESPGDTFGQVVNGVGDVDGDGVPDFGCGAEGHSSQGPNRGRVYIYSGSTATLLRIHDGFANHDRLGSAIGRIGDRNGDGRDDYILGADQGTGGSGKAWVIDGASGVVSCSLASPSGGANYGSYAMGRSVGDLTGDRVPDFFVTDFAHANGTGRVYVHDGASCSLLYQLSGEKPGDTFGTGSGRAGDLDGDGLPDLVFGALGGGTAGRGHVRFFRGTDGAALGRWTGDTPGAGFGFSPMGGAFLDGDTQPDLVVGLPSPNNSQGLLYAFSGLPLPPRQTCPAALNSTGQPAQLDTLRSLSLAENELRLRTQGLPPGESGVFFYGATDIQQPFGDGWLCVGRPLYRVGAPVAADAGGKATLDLDFTSPPFNQGAGSALAGDSWTFQFWYRDSASASGVNLSSGLRLTWCP